MAGDHGAFEAAVGQLRADLSHLIQLAEEADADSWGADIFRRLLSYIHAVLTDLERSDTRAQLSPAAFENLNQLGAELELQRWADVWPSHTVYTDAVAHALRAVDEYRALGRARIGGAAAT